MANHTFILLKLSYLIMVDFTTSEWTTNLAAKHCSYSNNDRFCLYRAALSAIYLIVYYHVNPRAFSEHNVTVGA